MSYGFRIRLKLPNDHRINLASQRVLLTPEDVLPAIFITSAERDKDATQTPNLVVRSDGYVTEDEARAVGERTRDILRIAFVSFASQLISLIGATAASTRGFLTICQRRRGREFSMTGMA